MTREALDPEPATRPDALRLLILIDSLGLGGAESLLVHFAETARAQNISIQVATLDRQGSPRFQMVEALRSLGIQPMFLGIPRLLTPSAAPRLAALFRRSGCDVVHAHLGDSITLAVPAARVVGIPVVCTFHHVPADLPRREGVKEWLSVQAASRSARWVFVSASQRDAFVKRYPGKSGRSTVIHNGIDLAPFTSAPQALPPELAIPAGVPVAVILAALRAPKGHRVAIEAWTRVHREFPDARLLLVGSGPEEDNLRRFVAEQDLEEVVVFAGFRTDIARLLQGSTMAISASETEALPTALMEAAAAGLPVVATAVGGTPELVDDGRTGRLIPPGRPDLLTEVVLELLRDPAKLARMSSSAKAAAETRFGSAVWVAKLRRAYVAGLAEGRSRRSRTGRRPATISRP